jgi:hypothetical protein
MNMKAETYGKNNGLKQVKSSITLLAEGVPTLFMINPYGVVDGLRNNIILVKKPL